MDSEFNRDFIKEMNDVITSGKNISYWTDSIEPIRYEHLNKNIDVDVVVVGAGIAGVTTAYILSKSNRTVALVDDGFIGSGETGRTTAHIVNALDDRFFTLEKFFGEKGSLLAGESHTMALNYIEEVIQQENIDCDFERMDGYLFLHQTDEKESLDKEYEATKRARLDAEMVNTIPGLSGYNGPALKFPRQATFHPMKYIRALADIAHKFECKIFTETKIVDFDENGVVSQDGFRINAKSLVFTTNTPINNTVNTHIKIAPYRTYVLGYIIKKDVLPKALWWDTGDHKSKWPTYPYHYVRTQKFNDTHDLLIVGGEDHKTGQAESEDIPEEERFVNLNKWTKEHFPQVGLLAYGWSGQVIEPMDHLAYIGRNPGDDNVYIATGFSGNGMTHGTLAGIIISDQILGKTNRWEDLYDPSRKKFQGAGTLLKEQMNVMKQYGAYFSPGDIKSVDELDYNCGAILRQGLSKIAVYKDEKGEIYAFSAICPHLKCIVNWNNEEKTFDCPCHGSRFTRFGQVVNGPALEGLEPVEVKK